MTLRISQRIEESYEALSAAARAAGPEALSVETSETTTDADGRSLHMV